MNISVSSVIGIILCCLWIAPVTAAPHSAPDSSRALDTQIEHVLELLSRGDIDEAAVLTRQLTRRFPRFRLGHWLNAELSSVLAMDIPLATSDTNWSEQHVDLMLEAKTRFETYRKRVKQSAQDATLMPRSLAHLGQNISDAIVVDLSRSELMHYAVNQGTPTLVQRHYISSGSAGIGKRLEGDLRTPLGVYRIHGYRRESTLPELYGDGALTLDYPNALDQALGRTGSGIWLHGVPRANHSRAPWSSEGCVTMSNDHLTDLVARVDRRSTVVVLADKVQWLDPVELAAVRQNWANVAKKHLTEIELGQDSAVIGGPGTPATTSTQISAGTLIEVPDTGRNEWLAWWPAGEAAGPTAWRFLALPASPEALPTP